MTPISVSAYQALIAESRVIERDAYGEKVLVGADGTFIKIFRTKKVFSTAVIKPYAVRFRDNTTKLTRLGIPTVRVHSVSYCADNRRHLVAYSPLPGETLRQVLRQKAVLEPLIKCFASFLAELHRRGVYFRSIHFGNVIVQPETDALGLIDVADMRFRPWPLGLLARARNFRHFLRYREDVDFLRSFGFERFLDVYLDAAALDGQRRKIFRYLVGRTLRKL
jgi:hypothetical protein